MSDFGDVMSLWSRFVQRLLPSVYRKHNKRLSDISKMGYVTLEDYKQDIRDIDLELKEINVTLEYYRDRRVLLEEWRHIVEVKIGKWNEESTCSYCKYCNNLYCSRFDMVVDGGATCECFDWK